MAITIGIGTGLALAIVAVVGLLVLAAIVIAWLLIGGVVKVLVGDGSSGGVFSGLGDLAKGIVGDEGLLGGGFMGTVGIIAVVGVGIGLLLLLSGFTFSGKGKDVLSPAFKEVKDLAKSAGGALQDAASSASKSVSGLVKGAN